MQRYTIFFITVTALHVSGGFSAHHQELKKCTHSNRCVSSLLAPTAEVSKWGHRLTHASGSSKQAWHILDDVCTFSELLMMGGETAWNTLSTDSDKEYCITLHLVGYILRNTLAVHGPMNVKFLVLPSSCPAGTRNFSYLKLTIHIHLVYRLRTCTSYISEKFLDPWISVQITSHEYTWIHTESQYTDILNALPKQFTFGKLLDVMS
jgi:hypothetical protein